jgi:hypothetical protein
MPHVFKMASHEAEPSHIQLFSRGQFITAAIVASPRQRGDMSWIITRTDFHTDVMAAMWELWDFALKGKTFVERNLHDDIIGSSTTSQTDEEPHTHEEGEKVPDQTPARVLAVTNKTDNEEEDKKVERSKEPNPEAPAFEVASLLASLQPTVEDEEEGGDEDDDDDDDLYSAEY